MIEAPGFSTETFRDYYDNEPQFERDAYIVFDWGGGGYDWDRFVILASKVDGRLFTARGSGCSCNDLYDDTYSLDGPSGLGEPVTKAAALDEVKEWEAATDETYRAEDRKGAHASAMEALFRWEKATGL